MIPDAWEFVLLALSAYRTWQLLANDSILDRERARLTAGAREFLACPFCAGFWVALGWWAAWLLWPHGAVVAAVPFALSAVLVIVAVGVMHVSAD